MGSKAKTVTDVAKFMCEADENYLKLRDQGHKELGLDLIFLARRHLANLTCSLFLNMEEVDLEDRRMIFIEAYQEDIKETIERYRLSLPPGVGFFL